LSPQGIETHPLAKMARLLGIKEPGTLPAHNSEFWVYQLHFEAQNGNYGATGFGVRLLVEYLKNLTQ